MPWYEQEVLRSLNLSNNELASLDEEVGGFEDLESLDVGTDDSVPCYDQN